MQRSPGSSKHGDFLPFVQPRDAVSRRRGWKAVYLQLVAALVGLRLLLMALAGLRGEPRCVHIGSNHLETQFVNRSACVTRPHIQQTIVDLVGNLSRVFEANDIEYWLDSGTLLGAYRNGTVIPHDSDADVGITVAAFRKLRQGNFQVPTGYVLYVMGASHFPDGGRDPGIPARVVSTSTGLYVDVFVFFDRFSGRQQPDAFLREFPFFHLGDTTSRADEYSALEGGVDADTSSLQLFGPLPSLCFTDCYRCPKVKRGGGRRDFAIPHAWVFPLRECAFGGAVTVACPHESAKYLRHLYGPDFMVPDQ